MQKWSTIKINLFMTGSNLGRVFQVRYFDGIICSWKENKFQSAMLDLSSKSIGLWAGIGTAAFLGYCIYFDKKRRWILFVNNILPYFVKSILVMWSIFIMPTAILAEAYCFTRVPKNLSSSEICFLGFLCLKILHRTQIH